MEALLGAPCCLAVTVLRAGSHSVRCRERKEKLATGSILQEDRAGSPMAWAQCEVATETLLLAPAAATTGDSACVTELRVGGCKETVSGRYWDVPRADGGRDGLPGLSWEVLLAHCALPGSLAWAAPCLRLRLPMGSHPHLVKALGALGADGLEVPRAQAWQRWICHLPTPCH